MKKRNSRILAVFAVVIMVLTAAVIFTACNSDDDYGDVAKKAAKSVGYVGKCFYDGLKLTWDKVTDAESYDLYVNGEKVETFTASKELSYAMETEEDSFTARVDVKYTDNDGEVKTNKGIATTLSKLGVFPTPSLNYGVFSWDEVSGATGYMVKIGTNAPVLVTTNEYSDVTTGSGTISVKPVMDKTSGYYYVYSAPKSYDIIASPVAYFTKDTRTIYWDSVSDAAGYKIYIQKDGVDVVDIPDFGKESVQYNEFMFADPGTYTVKICAKGNSVAGKNDSKPYAFTVKRLASPSGIKVADENGSALVSWLPVDGATQYNVILPTGEPVRTSDIFQRYTITDSPVEVNHSFSVYSTSVEPYTLDSLNASEITATQLAMVTNIRVQNSTLVWDTVAKAQSYVVYVDGTEHSVDTNEYIIDIAAGNHSVKIMAVGNGKEVLRSTYTAPQTITKLATPDSLSIENYVLTWSPVAGAVSYSVVLENGNELYNTTVNNVEIVCSDIKASTALYVVARGNGDHVSDSNASLTKMLYLIDVPQVNCSKTGVTWSEVKNASSYTVYIGDYKRSSTGTSFDMDEFGADTYAVKVKAVGDGSTYFDSEACEPITVRKLASVVFNYTNTGVEWSTVIQAANYEIMVDGEMPEILSNSQRTKDIEFTIAGEHTIAMRAAGDGINTVSSAWSSGTITSVLLPTPSGFSLTREGMDYVITSQTVENAQGYLFKIGGTVFESAEPVYRYTLSNPGTLKISTAARGNKFSYINSNFCQETEFTYLNPVTNIEFEKTDIDFYTVTWSNVSKASSYRVVIKKYADAADTEPADTVNTVRTVASIDTDTEGYSKIEVEVTAVGNGSTTFDSAPQSASKVLS